MFLRATLVTLALALLFVAGPAQPQSSRVCYLYDYGARADYFGGTSYTDNTPPWNTAMSSGCLTIVLPGGGGYMAFKSPPYEIGLWVNVVCEGSECNLVKDYVGMRAEFIKLGADSLTLKDVRLFNATGKGGGTAIGRTARFPGDGPQNITLENIVVSTFHANEDMFSICIAVDGGLEGPNYGSRRHHFTNIITQGCSDFGILLAGVNGVTIDGVICGGTWGIWLMSKDDNSSNSVIASDLVNCSVYVLGPVSASAFYAQEFAWVITDGNVGSVSFFSATNTVAPLLYGVNNHMWTNGGVLP